MATVPVIAELGFKLRFSGPHVLALPQVPDDTPSLPGIHVPRCRMRGVGKSPGSVIRLM